MTYQCHACGREQPTQTPDHRCPRAYCGGTLFLIQDEPVRKPLEHVPPDQFRAATGRPPGNHRRPALYCFNCGAELRRTSSVVKFPHCLEAACVDAASVARHEAMRVRAA